jgi:hypothetical protein
VIAIRGKAELGLAALVGPIHEYSLAICTFTRCTALTPTLCAFAVEMMPLPACSASLMYCSTSAAIFARPTCLPSALARAKPALTPSWDHCPLELGEDAQHPEHGLARWRGRVETLLVQVEIDPLAVQLAEQGQGDSEGVFGMAEGIAMTQADVKYKGRKPTALAQANQVRPLRKAGVAPAAIARQLGISRVRVRGRSIIWNYRRNKQ